MVSTKNWAMVGSLRASPACMCSCDHLSKG
jgi:hypothetical protein